MLHLEYDLRQLANQHFEPSSVVCLFLSPASHFNKLASTFPLMQLLILLTNLEHLRDKWLATEERVRTADVISMVKPEPEL